MLIVEPAVLLKAKPPPYKELALQVVIVKSVIVIETVVPYVKLIIPPDADAYTVSKYGVYSIKAEVPV
jgi:hypothetical protein